MYIKGFIANLEKHLEGELIGEWITFPISEEELNEVLKRIGIGENNYICPKCGNHMEELEYDSFHYPLCYDEETLGFYYANKINSIDFHNDEILKKYFDFERYGRDLALSINGNFSSYGFIKQF